MSKSTRQRHYGADGEIKFVAHRNLYVGFWGGKVVVTKRTHNACFLVLERDYGAKAAVSVVPDTKPVVKTVVSKELQEFVDRENTMAQMFNRPAVDLANAADRQLIAGSIDCRLSPENLSCDGELPRSQVQARYRFLTRAGEQLLKLDPSVQIYELSV